MKPIHIVYPEHEKASESAATTKILHHLWKNSNWQTAVRYRSGKGYNVDDASKLHEYFSNQIANWHPISEPTPLSLFKLRFYFQQLIQYLDAKEKLANGSDPINEGFYRDSMSSAYKDLLGTAYELSESAFWVDPHQGIVSDAKLEKYRSKLRVDPRKVLFIHSELTF